MCRQQISLPALCQHLSETVAVSVPTYEVAYALMHFCHELPHRPVPFAGLESKVVLLPGSAMMATYPLHPGTPGMSRLGS